MKKTSSTTPVKTKPIKKPKPELKWQTGAYERYAEYKFILPYQFLLLCRLMDVTPWEVVLDFMDNLSCDSFNRDGRDKAKDHLVNYFIEHRYGRHQYSEAEIREMFKEMDALGLLFPGDGSSKLVNLYADWRDKHHNYWFKKWFRKPRRKLSKAEPL